MNNKYRVNNKRLSKYLYSLGFDREYGLKIIRNIGYLKKQVI